MAACSLAALAVCLAPAFVAAGVHATTTPTADSARSRAERALREGEYALAEQLFRELLSKDERNTNARLGLSFSLLKQRNLLAAYEQAALVAAANPLSARAHALMGSALLTTGELREAVKEFRTARNLDKDEAIAIAGLATVDLYENRFYESLEGFRRAIDLAPNEPDYLFNLAQVAARSERFTEAANAYERFLRVAPRTDEERRERIRGLVHFLRYLGTVSRLHVPAGLPQVVVPFDSVDDRPIITVQINGSKEPLRFILDTGSSMTVISEETARRVGVREVSRGGNARGIGGDGRFGIVYGFLSSIQIGDARMENVPVYIRRLFNTHNPVDGYIGLAIISRYVTTVDYGTRTFTLDREPKEERHQPWMALTPFSGVEIPIRTTLGGFLSGEVMLDGIDRPLNFIIDTGASISVVSQRVATHSEMSRFTRKTRMRVYGAAGVAEDVQMMLLPRIVLGSYARENIPAAVLDLGSISEAAGFDQTGILGGNFLRHFRITFNFPKGIVRLKPVTSTMPTRVGPPLEAVPE